MLLSNCFVYVLLAGTHQFGQSKIFVDFLLQFQVVLNDKKAKIRRLKQEGKTLNMSLHCTQRYIIMHSIYGTYYLHCFVLATHTCYLHVIPFQN